MLGFRLKTEDSKLCCTSLVGIYYVMDVVLFRNEFGLFMLSTLHLS